MGGTAPPTSLLGPFSPMSSKKMLNLKRERPHFFLGKTPLLAILSFDRSVVIF